MKKTNRKIKAWAVVRPDGEIIQYRDYSKEPNDVLMRICPTRKLAKQIVVNCGEVVPVEIIVKEKER